MNLMNEQRKLFSENIAKKKDDIIKKAINSVIGEDWHVSELIGRGEFLILPDKTELFKFDGVDLVHFISTKFDIDDSTDLWTTTIEYKSLNKLN